MLKRDGFKLFICAMVAAFFLALPFVVTSLNGACLLYTSDATDE